MGQLHDQTKKTAKIAFDSKTFLNVLFLTTFFILVIINIFTYFELGNLEKGNTRIIYTYQVLQKANQINTTLLAAENDQLMYLLTGNSLYRDQFNNGVNDIFKTLTIIKKLTIDNPNQERRLATITEILKERVKILQTLVQAKQVNKITIPEILKSFENNEASSKQLKQFINDVAEEEFVILKGQNEAAIQDYRDAMLFLLSISIITIFLFIVSFVLINRQLSKRIQAEEKRTKLENELKGIIEGATELIAAADLNGRLIIYNTAYQTEFNRAYGKQIAIGTTIEESLSKVASDESKHLLKCWQKALSGQIFVDIVTIGNRIYEITSTIIRNIENAMIGAALVCRNIDKRIEQEKSLQELNKQLNIGINNLSDQNNKMTYLVELNDAVQLCSTIDEATKVLTYFCEKILDFSNGILYIFNQDEKNLEAKATWGDRFPHQSTFFPEECWGLRRGHFYEIKNAHNEIVCEHVKSLGNSPNSYFCMPLIAQNAILGLLYLTLSENQQLTDNQRLLITAISEASALAIANIRLRETLRFESMHDPLTGLFNRRYLEEFLSKALNQAKRQNIPLAVIMLDLDHFKLFNDNYGHETGDSLLKELGRLLFLEIRSGDIACRFGGEEFIVILYNCSLDSAKNRIEVLRKKICKMQVPHVEGSLQPITASFGIAMFPENGSSQNDLTEAADKALYKAKNTGRNKVVVFSELNNQISNPVSKNSDSDTQLIKKDFNSAKDQIDYIMRHDALTGLLNRTAIAEELDKLISTTSPTALIAVIMMDLDRFGYINDSLGHEKGDLILQKFAKRIKKMTQNKKDLTARFAADKFILVLSSLTHFDQLIQQLELILESIKKRMLINNHEIFLTASIGISLYPQDGVTTNILIQNADTALHKAKEKGGHFYQFSSPDLSHIFSEKLLLENELRQAIISNQFHVHYQPVVDLSTGQIVSLEALIRWQHPQRGLLYPDAFLPIAEESDLIIPMGEWILRETCNKIALNPYGPPIAVNLSIRQFNLQYDLLAYIKNIIKEYNIDPKKLSVEITESLMNSNVERTLEALCALKKIGVGISYDDFGTGYNSLNFLKQFIPDRIKIDKSFINSITDNAISLAIVKSSITLCHSLGIKVIAEGVESLEQIKMLIQENCDEIQGDYFSRALPIEEINQLLKSKKILKSS